jgi:hypothetical protein
VSVRRPTTILAALTVAAAVAMTGLGSAAARGRGGSRPPTEVVHVTAVATAPCPLSRGEQRLQSAKADAKASQAVAKKGAGRCAGCCQAGRGREPQGGAGPGREAGSAQGCSGR